MGVIYKNQLVNTHRQHSDKKITKKYVNNAFFTHKKNMTCKQIFIKFSQNKSENVNKLSSV